MPHLYTRRPAGDRRKPHPRRVRAVLRIYGCLHLAGHPVSPPRTRTIHGARPIGIKSN